MHKKILTRSLLFLIFSVLMLSFQIPFVFASEDYVFLGGDSIGLKFSTAVTITGKFQVETTNGKQSPWKNSDLEIGDQIIAFDDEEVTSNQALLNCLTRCNDDTVILTLKRDNQEFDTNINVLKTKNNEKSIGLYIKDQIIGVGTLTFIDPKTKIYASLGHGIFDTAIAVGTTTGKVVHSNVETIKKGTPGVPGEKRASIEKTVIGTILKNEVTGVYGLINDNSQTREKVTLASQSDVKTGRAKIYTVTSQNKIEGYDIMITSVNKQDSKNIKGLKIKVTDQRLISIAGGIVQGMSGSPIVQDGKLVGAVSHVTVDNPLIGYGVHINWMVDDLKNLDTTLKIPVSIEEQKIEIAV